MRIISGKYKKRVLISPKDKSIRPTSDRQRESLFNILTSMNSIATARVLDLFAGTGALGIEALSRGARSIVFVDNSRKAIGLIENNIKNLQIEDLTEVIQCNIIKSLSCLDHYVFDLILMDPPYHHSYINKTLIHIINQKCFDENTIIVAEHAASESIQIPEQIKELDHRKYGNTMFRFFKVRFLLDSVYYDIPEK